MRARGPPNNGSSPPGARVAGEVGKVASFEGLCHERYDEKMPRAFELDERLGVTAEPPATKASRQRRKPTLASALKQASKAGVNVNGATVATDGSVSLTSVRPRARTFETKILGMRS